MFMPDEPISSMEEDKLGRRIFAARLAQVLHTWEPEESIVVGLYGAWGSGKSSLVNMALEQIQQLSEQNSIATNKPTVIDRLRNYLPERIRVSSSSEKQQSPIIIHFNPWYFSNTDELLQAFFVQVFSAVSHRSAKFKKVIEERLKRYGEALEKTEKLPAVGSPMSVLGGLLKFAISENSLSASRDELNRAFRELEQKVIIVIDDLDRLRQDEIRQMLQLVKLNANFPNTIYLLAADREVIEKALDTEQGIAGRGYLEKIVQAGFDIPPIDPSYISDLLVEELGRALVGYEGSGDEARWTQIYQTGFRGFFVNLRDVKRFINGLSFNLSLVAPEINIVDFIGIEAIRVFAPEVYNDIAQNKALFTSLRAPDKAKDLKPWLDEIFDQSGHYSANCRNITMSLFPQLESVYRNTSYPVNYLDIWKKSRRICSPQIFDFYFLLGVPVGEVSQMELDHLKNDARNYEHLKQTFQVIVESGRYRQLLERLEGILDGLDSIAVQNLCALLLEIGDSMPDEPKGFLSINDGWLLARLIYQLLLRMEGEERCNWFKEQIREGASLHTVLQQVSIAESRLEKRDEIVFELSCLEELKQVCIVRIETAARDDSLQSVKNLNFVLTMWRDWGEKPEDVDEYVQGMIETPEKVVALLVGFLGRRDSFVGYAHSVNWVIDLQELDKFVDPEEIQSTLAIFSDNTKPHKLSRKEELAVQAFQKALQSAQTESS